MVFGRRTKRSSVFTAHQNGGVDNPGANPEDPTANDDAKSVGSDEVEDADFLKFPNNPKAEDEPSTNALEEDHTMEVNVIATPQEASQESPVVPESQPLHQTPIVEEVVMQPTPETPAAPIKIHPLASTPQPPDTGAPRSTPVCGDSVSVPASSQCTAYATPRPVVPPEVMAQLALVSPLSAIPHGETTADAKPLPVFSDDSDDEDDVMASPAVFPSEVDELEDRDCTPAAGAIPSSQPPNSEPPKRKQRLSWRACGVSSKKEKVSGKNGDDKEHPSSLPLTVEKDCLVVGCDEAGRGPIAGPVVTAAFVTVPSAFVPTGINDSKKVSTEDKRTSVYESLLVTPGIVFTTLEIDNKEIDRLNILRASLDGMAECARFALHTVDALVKVQESMAGGSATNTKQPLGSNEILSAADIEEITAEEMMEKTVEKQAEENQEKSTEENKENDTDNVESKKQDTEKPEVCMMTLDIPPDVKKTILDTIPRMPHLGCKLTVGIGGNAIETAKMFQGCKTAVESRKRMVLIDGPHVPAPLQNQELFCEGSVNKWEVVPQAVVKGDGRIYSIAAASIFAKVTRDKIMGDLHVLYPHWELDKHKGYPTPDHKATVVSDVGVAPIHRLSFAPIKGMLQEGKLVVPPELKSHADAYLQRLRNQEEKKVFEKRRKENEKKEKIAPKKRVRKDSEEALKQTNQDANVGKKMKTEGTLLRFLQNKSVPT